MARAERPFRLLSKGVGNESYTLHLPFFLRQVGKFPEAEDLEVDAAIPIRLGNRAATIIRKEHYFIIRVPGFGSVAAAEEFIRKIGTALLLITLEKRMGIHFEHKPVPIEREHNKELRNAFPPELYGEWEQRADGTYTDGGVWPARTVVIPEHERIIEHKMLWGRRVAVLTSQLISEVFDEANAKYDSAKLFVNDKAKLAFDLFSTAYSQENRQTTFIHLVTALEILSKRARAPHLSLTTIDTLIGAVREKRDEYADATGQADKAAYDQLDELANRLRELKTQSISAAVRELVYHAVYAKEGVSREESDKRVREIYAVRSELVHIGEIKTKHSRTAYERFGAINELERIVREVLLAEISKALKPC